MNAKQTQTVVNYLNEHFTDKDGFRQHLMQIAKVQGKIVASNGHLLAEIDPDVYPSFKNAGENKDDFPPYRNILGDYEVTHKVAYEGDIDSLVTLDKEDYSETPPEEIVCKFCKGEGGIDHECDCEYCMEDWEECQKCDGTGVITKTPQKRKIITIEGNSMRYYFRGFYFQQATELLRLMKPKTIKLYLCIHSNTRPVIFEADGLMALAMPMSIFSREEETFLYTKNINLETEIA